MQNSKKIDNIVTTARQSSAKTLSQRMISYKNRSITQKIYTSNPSLNKLDRQPRICITIGQQKNQPPISRTEASCILMRNGVPFLYTPTEISNYNPNVISPFGLAFRGKKIKERNDRGNMFALHSGYYTERPNTYMTRSYLNMRSKWK
jgi:hypothetical protein